MVRAVARNGGVVMVNFYSGFVDEAYNKAREALAPEVQKAYDALKVKYQDDPVSLQREELRVDREFAAPIPRPPLKSLLPHIQHAPLLARQRCEPLEQLALLLGELLRDLDGHAHVLVAALVAVEMGDALAAQPENLSALRAGGDLHLHLAVQRRHLDGGAERRLGEADGHLADDLGVFASHALVLLHLHHHVEIAGRAAAFAGLALAVQLQPRAGIDP